MQEARRQAALINADGSDFSPLDYARTGIPFENVSDAEHLADGVSLALGYCSTS
ncbi:hypothetical protein NKH14_10910 [Mesorhizobium sp. M1380]|uniref:hypothetical protein n=1 Tax=Mesorhizobium sp. M1380 TaxID=2957093 RepID=UPI00333CBCE9